MGLGFFFIGVSILRICYFFSDYYLVGYYNNVLQSFYGNFNNFSPNYKLLVKIGYFSFFMGMTIFLAVLEDLLKLFRIKIISLSHFFLILFCCLLIPFIIQEIVFSFVAAFDLFIIFLSLVRLSRQLQQNLEPVVFLLNIGSILVILGTFLDTIYIKEFQYISPTLPAIFIILGVFFIMFPSFFDSETLSQFTLIWWFILIAINIILIPITFLCFYGANMPFIFSIVIILSTILYLSITFYTILRIKVSLQSIKLSDMKYKQKKLPFLGLFQKIRLLNKAKEEISEELELNEGNLFQITDNLINKRKYYIRYLTYKETLRKIISFLGKILKIIQSGKIINLYRIPL